MKNKIRVVKVLAFLSIFLTICIFANWLLNTNVRSYITTDTKDADGCDVVFIGTSQGLNDLNPVMMWDQNGIPGYNFCAAGQYIGTTSYMLKDLYRYHAPSVVVLDYESLTRPDDFLTISNKLCSLPMISGLKNRFDMYQDIIGEAPIYFIPMLRYHNRWKEIGRMDFRVEHTVLGAQTSPRIQDITKDMPESFEQTQSVAIGERELGYLEKIYEETKQHGSELVLIDLPSYSSAEIEAMQPAILQWAKERNVQICEANCKQAFEKMGLQPQDFGDLYHLNANGQEKLSYFAGDWLSENCGQLTDQRESKEGSLWEEKMPAFRRYFNDLKLMMTTDMVSYFERLKDGNYTIAVSLTGEYLSKANASDEQALHQALASIGLGQDVIDVGGGYVKTPDGTFIFASYGEKKFLWYEKLKQDDLVMRGSTVTDDEGKEMTRTEIIIDRSDHSKVENGMNVLVYDHDINEMVESVGFDAANHYAIVR